VPPCPQCGPYYQSCHCSCLAFTPYSSVEPTTLKNAGNSCSPVKQLSCLASHMVRHVLSHDWAHVPPPDHDSSPSMTRHVASPYLLIYQPHFPLTMLCPATLLVGCLYPYHLPHFWSDATLSFSYHRSAPATLLTGPHTHSSSFYLSLLLPSMYKHGLCTLVCVHPSSYISL